MRNLFVKNNFAHFVIDINQEGPIKLVNLITLLEGIKELNEKIIIKYQLDEDIEDLTIKLNCNRQVLLKLLKQEKHF